MAWWQWLLLVAGTLIGALAVWHYGSMIRPINRLLNDAGRGRVEKVRRRLDRGVDVNGKGSLGLTPLTAAVSNQRLEVARLLIARGARVEGTILRLPMVVWLAGERQPEFVRLLLEHGASAGEPGPHGLSALYLAAENEDADTLQALIEHGADVNYASGAMLTPLLVSLNEGHVPGVELLLKHGADPNLTDLHEPALHLAVGQAHQEALFAGHETERWIRLVDLLLEHGADPNQIYSGYSTALHEAVVYGLPTITQRMVARGGDPKRRTGDGESCWDIARRNGDERMLEALGPEPPDPW